VSERTSLSPLTIVWLLGITQILGYGTLYYSFSILAADIATTFEWPVAWIFGAFSLALLAGGLVSPFVGRYVDRFGAARIMVVGSVASAAALALIALAPSAPIFAAALIVVELVAPLVLYDTAFACLVQTVGADAGRRITHLTLIAGFASTLFWPLTSLLHASLDWRTIYGLFALTNLLLCLPIHMLLWKRTHRIVRSAPAADGASPAPEPQGAGRLVFVLMAIGFSVSGFTLSAVLTQMVPVLREVGLGTAAVLVSALFGPAQVLVRLANLVFGAGRHPLTLSIVVALLLPAAVAILGFTAPAIAGAILFAALFGFGSGLKSIVQGTLPLALFGSAGYGERLGHLAAARLVLASAAPFVMAFLMEAFGARTALYAMAVIGLFGLLPFLAIRHLTATRRIVHSPG